jgi:hypothetical protein
MMPIGRLYRALLGDMVEARVVKGFQLSRKRREESE